MSITKPIRANYIKKIKNQIPNSVESCNVHISHDLCQHSPCIRTTVSDKQNWEPAVDFFLLSRLSRPSTPMFLFLFKKTPLNCWNNPMLSIVSAKTNLVFLTEDFICSGSFITDCCARKKMYNFCTLHFNDILLYLSLVSSQMIWYQWYTWLY